MFTAEQSLCEADQAFSGGRLLAGDSGPQQLADFVFKGPPIRRCARLEASM
jgi:hypothetical protein